jgi:hypothetical protein
VNDEKITIRGIHATVSAADLWTAEERHGAPGLRKIITAAVSAAVHHATTAETSAAVRRAITAEHVAALHAAGVCDALIAARLGYSKSTIATARRRLHLRPNPCHNTIRKTP